MVYLGAVLGLRFSEIAGLKVRHLDLRRRQLTVAGTLSEVNGKIIEEDPDFLRDAPHTTPISRPNDAKAFKEPILRWKR